MSFLTGTQTELIYAQPAAGTTLTGVTATNVNLAPPPVLPANFFDPTYGRGKALMIDARGVLTSASATPGTLTLAVVFGGSNTALVTCVTPTLTVSMTNVFWLMRAMIVCTAVGATGSMTSSAQLSFNNSTTASTSLTDVGAPANTAPASWAVAYDTTTAQAINLRATLGAATDSLTVVQFFLWGLN